MRSRLLGGLFTLALGFQLISACSESAGADRVGNSTTGREVPSGTDGSSLGIGGGLIIDDTNVLLDMPAPAGCGNGELTPDEACDDGNTDGDDGCSANCLVVAPGYSCHPVGELCHEIARCGDAVVAASELCDDGNVDAGDGCSPTCKLELGFKCEGEPSTCTATTCGDGVQEGAEACDDGNAAPFDGCSAECQAEPDCTAGACASECGDGLLLGEECDDGNNKSGDGCSAECTIEEGFECTQNVSEGVEGDVLRVNAIFRDFTVDHPDFGVQCDSLATGMVENMLGADNKPIIAQTGNTVCVTSEASFNEWYNTGDNNREIVGNILLYDNGMGGYVNRWGENGEQWLGVAEGGQITYCGPGGTGCTECTLAADDYCWDPCLPWGNGNTQACSAPAEYFDGEPAFFPIDDAPNAFMDEQYEAVIAPAYGWANWPAESELVPDAGLHNFYFTSEIQYWFQYDAGASATLDFTGDDDVWVFVNGQLAVDLGGVHVPESGSVTIDGTTGAGYGLEDGNVYAISVFHAERKRDGSSFRLTLEGFSTARTDCVPICGDGIVSLGEECDDGINDGGYGECGEGCTLGGYCGDGIVQEGEDCDDGNRIDGDSCGSACRVLVVK